MRWANILNEFIQHIKEISINNSESNFIEISQLNTDLAKLVNDMIETDHLTIRCYDNNDHLIDDIIIDNAFELMTLINSNEYSKIHALYCVSIDLK